MGKDKKSGETIGAEATDLILVTDSRDVVAAPDGNAFLDLVIRRQQLIKAALPAALSVTTDNDWVSIQGKPHLLADAVEKVRLLFAISASNPRQIKQESKDEKGYYYIWETWMDFRFPGSDEVLTCVGTASSRKPFYAKSGEAWNRLYQISEENIKKHSWTNCMHNGVTSLLGFKNVSWKDLTAARALTFDPKNVATVTFKEENGDNPPPPQQQQPKGKAKAKAKTKATGKTDTKGKSETASDQDRVATIGEFNTLIDFLMESENYSEDEVLEKYLKFSKPLEDGSTHPTLERVQQFKTTKAIAWLRKGIDAIKKNEDLSGLDEYLNAAGE